MQVNYFAIDPKLIISPAVARIYRVSAWISLILLVGIAAGWFSPENPHWIGAFAQPLLMVGVLSYVFMTAAMEVFLFRFDESGALKQVFWFVVMLVPLIGSALYCLVVYSRSASVKSISSRPL
jgi:hypothetical protein